MAFANKTKVSILAIFVVLQINLLFIEQIEAKACGYHKPCPCKSRPRPCEEEIVVVKERSRPCSCQQQPCNECANYTDQSTDINATVLGANANALNSGDSCAQCGKGSGGFGNGSNSNPCCGSK